MKSIGFIGAFDKTELITNIAKMLTAAGNKMLVVDSTVLQKSRYIIPAINQAKVYITTYEGIDFAIGFKSIGELNQYLEINERHRVEYDIALIDVDTRECFRNFNLVSAENNFFVISYDLFSVKRGLSILMELQGEMHLTEVLFAKKAELKQERYIDSLAANLPIRWKNKIYMPFEEGDATANIENQYVSKIKFNNLSGDYKDALILITSEIVNDDFKKIMRSI